MKAVIMGLGYIGLPTATLISSKGINVIGVDVNQKILDTVSKGKIHIVEPDLEGLVSYVVEKKFLQTSPIPQTADVFMITVPTPVADGNKPDITFVEQATRAVIPYLKEGDLYILESTSPVGTTDKMAEIIFSQRSELRDKIFISYCPERVLPGKILYELQHNDRIIGGINSASTAKAVAFYSQFVQGKLYETNAKTAEMCKLVENSFRDLNIAFANELSMICDTAGINVWELITMANRHPRVKILNPGPGVGGHCIAVDPWFLVDSFKEQATIIRTAREVNNNKTVWVKGKILKAVEAFKATHNRVPVVACMGISFKPDIDDLRESPSFELAKELIADKVNTLVVEPNISQHATMPLVTVDHAVSHGDIIVFLVAHKQFKSINTADKIVLDFCGITRAQCD